MKNEEQPDLERLLPDLEPPPPPAGLRARALAAARERMAAAPASRPVVEDLEQPHSPAGMGGRGGAARGRARRRQPRPGVRIHSKPAGHGGYPAR